MKKHLFTLAGATVGLALVSFSAQAAGNERPTFTKDVLPILQENCQTCHRPSGLNMSGMIAPMSFMTYQETRPWAKSIVKAISDKTMPPWHASEECADFFKNERTLTQEEIDTIVRWAATGAARGRAEDAPETPDFSSTGWNFGEPDLVLDFPEPFLVEDDVEDLYHNVVTQLTPEQLPEPRWIKSIEFKPGSDVVHHIIGYAAPPEDKEAVAAGEGVTRGMIGGNAPGTDQAEYDEGYGILLKPESFVTFAMHYHKEAGPGTAVLDASQIGIQFHDAPVTHPIEISTIAHGAFEIPPYAKDWRVGASRTFEEDTILISVMPHMHLRGSAAKYTAYYPDGTTELLLDVPNYDFNWQTQYDYAQNRFIPAGTRIEMEFLFDNSAENAERVGFNPARSIRFGGPTTDEMDLAWITIAPAQPTQVADAAHEAATAGDD